MTSDSGESAVASTDVANENEVRSLPGVCSPPMTRARLERRVRETARSDLRRCRRDWLRAHSWWVWPVLIAVLGLGLLVVVRRVETPEVRPSWTDLGEVVLYLLGSGSGPASSSSPLAAYATLIAAIVAGLVALRVSIYSPARLKRLEVSLGYVEQQLTKLWGPLYGEINLGQYYYDNLLTRLFDRDPEPGEENQESVARRPGEAVRLRLYGSGDEEDESFKFQRTQGSSTDEPLHGQNGVVVRRATVSLDPFCELDFRDERRPGPLWEEWASFSKPEALKRNRVIAQLIRDNHGLIGQDHLPDIQRFLAHEAEYRAAFERLWPADPDKRYAVSDLNREKARLRNRYPEAFEYHAYHRVRFLLFLQKKYRMQIDGARKADVLDATRRGARHRELSRSRPARDISFTAETWALRVQDAILSDRFTRRSVRWARMDVAWMLAEAAVGGEPRRPRGGEFTGPGGTGLEVSRLELQKVRTDFLSERERTSIERPRVPRAGRAIRSWNLFTYTQWVIRRARGWRQYVRRLLFPDVEDLRTFDTAVRWLSKAGLVKPSPGSQAPEHYTLVLLTWMAKDADAAPDVVEELPATGSDVPADHSRSDIIDLTGPSVEVDVQGERRQPPSTGPS